MSLHIPEAEEQLAFVKSRTVTRTHRITMMTIITLNYRAFSESQQFVTRAYRTWAQFSSNH